MDLETDGAESKTSCATNPILLKSVEYLPLMSTDDLMDQVPREECHLPASLTVWLLTDDLSFCTPRSHGAVPLDSKSVREVALNGDI